MIAFVVVVLRLIYVAKFGYRSPLGQPMKYAKVKKVLTVASVISVVIAAVALSADGLVLLAIVFVAGCVVAAHVVKFRNYLRAVMYWSEMKDPNTGEYVYSGNAQERDKTARMFIDADIDSGRLI
jgi:tellurite resistance protein TehA-like permease